MNKDKEQVNNYTDCIDYQNIKTGIISILNNDNEHYYNKLDHIFREEIVVEFLRNYEAIQKNVASKKPIKNVTVRIYRMCESGSFAELSKDLTETYARLSVK
tara:strand:+ start:183 stop:488 length:306 start_codon:yes stop_codon:yes gene_type:complete